MDEAEVACDTTLLIAGSLIETESTWSTDGLPPTVLALNETPCGGESDDFEATPFVVMGLLSGIDQLGPRAAS